MDYKFKEELNKYNIDVDVETSDINNFLIINNLDYGYSYLASRYFIEEKINNNNYDLIIDLHRDATNHDDTFININDIPCVKILFVVGALNENYEVNYHLAIKLNDMINEKYPGMSRGVILKKGPNVNGLYNQDLSDKMILLELGGNNNTEQEVINTINFISEVIGEYLYGNQSI
jgi:stage II sporulation protein P